MNNSGKIGMLYISENNWDNHYLCKHSNFILKNIENFLLHLRYKDLSSPQLSCLNALLKRIPTCTVSHPNSFQDAVSLVQSFPPGAGVGAI